MLLKLKNIGMIKESEVKLDGLTVIAGENDTGKSTVGRLLFSLIKSISRYKEDLEEDKDKKIQKIVERIYFRLRRKINLREDIKFRDLFFPPNFFKDIKKHFFDAIYERQNYLLQHGLEDIFNENKDLFNELEKIISNIDEEENSIRKRALGKMFVSEFVNEILNKYSIKEEMGKINIYEGENNILDILIKNNKIKEFVLYDEIYFLDSTLIETPLILNFEKSIEKSGTFFENIENKKFLLLGIPKIAFHLKDLDNKLKESYFEFNIFEEFKKEISLFEKINKIINGEVKYEKENKEFVYYKNGKEFKNINVASGIKSFGIIQMLIKGGFLNERTLLIIDEPEVHLHPKWQLKYAKIIVELIKNDITVLITSHSPYMIEALKRYSELEDIEDKTNFYLAENGYIYEQETLENIFEKLAIPMRELKKLKLKRYISDL